jgi:hypothetical protein
VIAKRAAWASVSISWLTHRQERKDSDAFACLCGSRMPRERTLPLFVNAQINLAHSRIVPPGGTNWEFAAFSNRASEHPWLQTKII